MHVDDWFLASGERGNDHSVIDRHDNGVPWTEGNLAEVLIDGQEYFTSLYSALRSTVPGDSIYLTGLEGDADELLEGTDTEVGTVLGDLAQHGVLVRGLVWRSHGASSSEEKNLMFSRAVNTAGGDVLLDNRIRRAGSHHQKIVVVRRATRPGDDVAFVGGMDLVHARSAGVRAGAGTIAWACGNRLAPGPPTVP
jgi:phosphatidylserine/phosphatidylglycerophosphate/cardiolipin synthase-like enzyme